MILYTINATPVQGVFSASENNTRVENYPKEVAELLQEHGIDGFTIYQVQGYWHGKSEVSFKIEIAMEADRKIYDIARELRDNYLQESVMITYADNSVEFI